MFVCPCCKRTLKQHIRYNVGIPVVWYDCICGYTSEKDIFYSNKTDSNYFFRLEQKQIK